MRVDSAHDGVALLVYRLLDGCEALSQRGIYRGEAGLRVLVQEGDGAGVLVDAELHIQEPCLDGGVEGCEALLQGLGLVVDGIDESVGRGLDLRRDELARAVDLQTQHLAVLVDGIDDGGALGVDLLAESLEAVEDGSVDVVETLLGGLVQYLDGACVFVDGHLYIGEVLVEQRVEGVETLLQCLVEVVNCFHEGRIVVDKRVAAIVDIGFQNLGACREAQGSDKQHRIDFLSHKIVVFKLLFLFSFYRLKGGRSMVNN